MGQSFMQKCKLHLQRLSQGDPLDATVAVGLLADEVQYQTVKNTPIREAYLGQQCSVSRRSVASDRFANGFGYGVC